MKTIIKISILLNVVLLGGLIFLWQRPRTGSVQAPATSGKVEPQASPGGMDLTPPVVKTVAEPQPFRWSQLVNTNDYCVFVANLRAAGCPETTVENIVRGDTEQAYSIMRGRLGVSPAEPGSWSAQAQAQMTAYLLGQFPATTAGRVADGRNDQPAAGQPTEAATLAAFLQNTELTTSGTTPEQAQETANLRATFLAQMSNVNPSPNNQSQSSPGEPDNATPTQAAMDDSQPSQTGTDSKRPVWHEPDPALLQAAEAESILGGLFGSGAAGQYDQYNLEQPGL
jgi:hypothetical protein